ncbi:hypothetical protein TTHERM_00933330 (macronuclear) [Tetrahymena thermophila SB210]|uniref:Uncharacterized protein n=1 Tax=Tetrahymena thermophila (strain SB210) TaxID=312017 RepID=I7MGM6_TETTS|nr:hypothetical protein TTHERM_00933330 [Tetrahymena thermophila SB210]EAS01644.2 hypothetical protein TTHERM_00933330 [Tetrahymena thermophila SB210]|eukprot:XP_001021889.2 hypothetical protein TTHERM_00933330 [Tetrahymena thermophila SB210]
MYPKNLCQNIQKLRAIIGSIIKHSIVKQIELIMLNVKEIAAKNDENPHITNEEIYQLHFQMFVNGNSLQKSTNIIMKYNITIKLIATSNVNACELALSSYELGSKILNLKAFIRASIYFKTFQKLEMDVI